ncbi:ImmA/IrrE family metallo-endopeptidase [Paenibacillus lactis]|uniref:ImmA/IrrE family metallo-endopeptidase n=1 Tax=Paenibacillus lactis TaxID=228574 RepID=UPI003D744A1E
MFRFYKLTPLEQFVEDLYLTHGILSPKQLNIGEVARCLNVWVYYKPITSRGLEIAPGMYTVNIDSRLASAEQWLDFLHELGHLLRHSGNQTILPKLFTQAQEADAENFVLYSALPISMIKQIQLPSSRIETIQTLAATFRVPFKLAEKRLDQIRRREYEGSLMNSYIKFNIARYQSAPSYEEVETAVYAYYDSSDDCTEPTQIIIQVDQQTLLNQDEFEFSLDGPFDRIEEHQLQNFAECKPVKFHDLDYTRYGRISLRLKNLAIRYYNSAFKFIVQRKDIEQVLHYYGADF